MVIFQRLSGANLIEFCRSLRFSLSSGLTLRDAVRLMAGKGPHSLRPVAEKIGGDLGAGWSFQDALAKQEKVFPSLFLALASVGEESGNLPEVLAELEKYYQVQQKLRREFISEITWPVTQFVAAVCVIAVLIYVLGILAVPVPGGASNEHLDPIGLGLLGPSGAVKFLVIVFGTIIGVSLAFWGLKRLLRRRALVERFLLGVPLIGAALRYIAMTRFCVALRLMLETKLSVLKSLRFALNATDNPAFSSYADEVENSLRKGNSITESLKVVKPLPDSFLGAVAIAEECGRLPESLHFQADQYDDLARRRLAVLNRFSSWLVWLGIAAFMILMIARIFINVYLKMIEGASGGKL
ncbi:MAG: type II secretion system F family protein [Planctomycetes bacterium]|nr:type II secretion system F family protein [Planctomycetota bacterium]